MADATFRSTFDISPEQYHAGLDILWVALGTTEIQHEGVFQACADKLAALTRRLAAAEADTAALVEALKGLAVCADYDPETGTGGYHCVLCHEETVRYLGLQHIATCPLHTAHPGAALLAKLQAMEAVVDASRLANKLGPNTRVEAALAALDKEGGDG